MLFSENPYTGAINAKIEEDSIDTLDKKLDDARRAFEEWRSLPVKERATFMLKLASVLEDHKEECARLITEEMGKVIRESRAEAEKCIWLCKHFAGQSEDYLACEIIKLMDAEGVIQHEPLGVILGIMPWNFPFWQSLRFAVPALMAGNVIVLKHSSIVPRCLLKLEELFELACFPDKVFQGLMISAQDVDHIINDNRIQGVSITGSVGAGKKVGEAAGKNVKKIVMELGGSDPSIVLEDADLQKAALNGVKSRMTNNGQSCIAAKRFILVESVATRFLQLFRKGMEKLVFGDPFDESTDYASLANEEQRVKLEKQVHESVDQGAVIYWQDKKAPGEKAFFNPMILTGIRPGMIAYHEELFGPVASIFIVRDAFEAIHVANDTSFGLGASIWTKDTERGKKLAGDIKAGMVFINEQVFSHPELPFGGMKESGTGRELSKAGIKEFTNQKMIYLPYTHVITRHKKRA